MAKQVEALYRRKERKVTAVQWTGEFKDLPQAFRAHKNASVSKGRLEVSGRNALVRRALTVSGVRPGNWLLRDMDGNLEVMSDERFREEYELSASEETAV